MKYRVNVRLGIHVIFFSEMIISFQVRALEQIHKEQEGQTNGTPLVWIHDYHLMLAANWVRQAADDKNLKLKLGFFLHIPFPPWDIFRLFPWADEILQGMLGKICGALI
jgi:trehalose 6-phosphate synthase/phosphatase